MFDLKITNGTIVDGTGADRFVGDIAITNGVIVAVQRGGGLQGDAAEVIDATGMIVAPGFVDIHTHYDGQVTWDGLLEPSSQHGVTTIVSGNCGVGFAPVRPGYEDALIELMEGVEDIPGTALTEGMTWGWESFPGYLDKLEELDLAVDFGVQIAHSAVRTYVMGERGARNEAASSEDIDLMGKYVTEAVEAGALGFSTSRTLGHRAMNGEPVPGTFAAEDELFGLGRAMARGGASVFELAPMGAAGEDIIAPKTEVEWMKRLAADIDCPVSFALIQVDAAPDLWREIMAESLAAHDAGAPIYPQVAARPFGMLLGFPGHHAFSKRPTYVELRAKLSHEELAAELLKPAVKAKILSETDLPSDPNVLFDGMNSLAQGMVDRTYSLGSPVDYEPTPDKTIAAIAKVQGRDPLEVLYDTYSEHNAGAMSMVPFFNYSEGNQDAVREMLLHPAGVAGLSDGGAHCAMICDASYPTYLLSFWAKEGARTRGPGLPIEYVVKKQSLDTATLYGLNDRGVIAEGKKGDINIIDMNRIEVGRPHMAYDLPAGGKRLLQGATGYVNTIVSGVVTRRNGVDTGARPGRLVRGQR
ncbi:MAG: amidohydrolase family protein [Acidimicrobiia bacterium]|nr:amidohydrolase family protein [Acidimicrobiia bacterium]